MSVKKSTYLILATFLILVLSTIYGIFFNKKCSDIGYQFGVISVYYCDFYNTWTVTSLNNVDRQSFQILNNIYAKDKNIVYVLGKPIEFADVVSFQVLKNEYAKDKNHVYSWGNVLGDAIPGTTHRASDWDKPDLQSFEVLTNSYTKDKNFVYYKNKRMSDADPTTFELLEPGYGIAKDALHVFVYNKSSDFLDAATFEIKRIDSPEVFEIRDKNGQYTLNELGSEILP